MARTWNQPPAFPTPTAEAVDLFGRCLDIEATPGATEKWESEGGARRTYLDLSSALHRALDLEPWRISPLDVHASFKEPKPYEDADDWREAKRLRAALLHALDLEDELC
jgi:hypothetical protein